jgi:hypothetical protein
MPKKLEKNSKIRKLIDLLTKIEGVDFFQTCMLLIQ